MKFALIGAAGYVAPRHMKAIKETGNELIAAADISDSVGILDRYFPNCQFFTSVNYFWEYLSHNKADYLTVCTPNCFHFIHSLNGMMAGTDIICEKPLVTSVRGLEDLERAEQDTGRKVNVILQLRVSPTMLKIKKNLKPGKHKVQMTYVTPRGPWYQESWKGDDNRSGGILFNIGIHLFDILLWLFGKVEDYSIKTKSKERAKGTISLENADVDWFLSIDRNDLPNGPGAYRLLTVDGQECRFDKVFADLHTDVYQKILQGQGFGCSDCYDSISLVEKLSK